MQLLEQSKQPNAFLAYQSKYDITLEYQCYLVHFLYVCIWCLQVSARRC